MKLGFSRSIIREVGLEFNGLKSDLLPRYITNKHPITIFVFIGKYILRTVKKVH